MSMCCPVLHQPRHQVECNICGIWGDHFQMRCNKESFSANSRLLTDFSHSSFMLASPDRYDGHCAYFVMVGPWFIRARSLYRLRNWEMKDEQSSAVCVFGERVAVYSINMATAPGRWETCPDVEALQLRHKSPGNWCHNGGSDEKLAVSKKKSMTSRLVGDTDVILMFLYRSLNYTICPYHYFPLQYFNGCFQSCLYVILWCWHISLTLGPHHFRLCIYLIACWESSLTTCVWFNSVLSETLTSYGKWHDHPIWLGGRLLLLGRLPAAATQQNNVKTW